MQGRDVLAKDYPPRDAVFAARDRCDETVERIRSVRTDRCLYIRNFHPERPHLQPNAYKDGKSIVATLRDAARRRQARRAREKLLFARRGRRRSCTTGQTDRWQVTEPRRRSRAPADARGCCAPGSTAGSTETNDRGPESEEMYDSDMAVYLGRGNPAVEKNIALMKKWAAEGK